MKIRNVGESVVLLYAFMTYLPQFLFHLFDEAALNQHYRIGEGTWGYAAFILLFFLLAFLLNRLTPPFATSWVGKIQILGRLFTSPLLTSTLCLVSLIVAIGFYATQGIGFRHVHRFTSSGFAVALFFLKPYIYAWMMYHYLTMLNRSETTSRRNKTMSIAFFLALAMGVTSSLEMIAVFWMAVFAFTTPDFLRDKFLNIRLVQISARKLLITVLILLPLLLFLLLSIISIGYFNKYGVEGAFTQIRNIGILGIVEQLMVRLSSSYSAAISFSAYNLFNLDLYAAAFQVPFENIAYRLSLIFTPDIPLDRPEITQISRLNYLNYDLDTSLENAGASPGLVGSAFFAAPIPLGFLIMAVFVTAIIRLINLAFQSVLETKRFVTILFMTSMTFPLFESPVDYLNFVDPAFVYLALYIAALLAISAQTVYARTS